MRKYIVAALMSFLTVSASGMAVLPPLYSTIAEIEEILHQLPNHINDAEPIESIQKNFNNNSYEIKTLRYLIQIDIVPDSRQVMGPAKFTLKFHEPLKK